MAFAIKAQVEDPQATLFAFTAQKTMYGGKNVSEGELISGGGAEKVWDRPGKRRV